MTHTHSSIRPASHSSRPAPGPRDEAERQERPARPKRKADEQPLATVTESHKRSRDLRSSAATSRERKHASHPNPVAANIRQRHAVVGRASDASALRRTAIAFTAKIKAAFDKQPPAPLHIILAHLQYACESSDMHMDWIHLSAILNRCGHRAAKGERLDDHALRFLERHITAQPDAPNAINIGNMSYGLRAVTDSLASRALAQALAIKVTASSATLDAQAIGNACYGLQRLGDSPDSRALAKALAIKVTDSSATLDAQHIGMACYGLQSLGDSPDSRALAKAQRNKVT